MSHSLSLVASPKSPVDIEKTAIPASGEQSTHADPELQEARIIDQNVLRNHSTQLVKLHSELHEASLQRAKDAQTIAELQHDMQCLYAHVAELKGMLASLTMEVHVLQSAVPNFAETAGAEEQCYACLSK